MRHFKKHLMLAVTFVFALLLMVGCAITGSSSRVTVDVEKDMTAGFEYKYAVNLGDEAGSSYELSLSKEGIVEINESAKTIKALAEGKVILTVTTSSGLNQSMWLRVAAPAVYAINYELNGGECSELVTSYTSVSEGVALATPTREGYNFVGWYDNAELAGEAVAEIPAGAKGDKTFYAKWDEIIIDYTVSFDSQGAGELASKTFNKYSGAVELPEVEKVGYTFAGWYNGEVKVEALDGADYEENITLVAKWEVVTYTVAYELDGGSLEGETKEYTVETETFQLVAPTKEGYKFLGWYVGEELVTEVAKGTTGNLTFTAKWEEIIIDYTVSFDTQGAGEVESKTFNKYSGAIELPQVEKAGYKFLGWYKGEELVEALDGADYEENIELVAKWELSVFEVSFDLNGASWEMDLAKFTEMILADFNTYGESTTKTTKESFKATSHPQIKNVFDDAELLAKYKWFFEFAIAEMTIAAELSGKNDYLADTVGMLERMIAGDTTAIGDANYADERTAFRWWIEGLLNETKRTGTGLYNQLMIDYGVAENLNRFVCAANGLSSTYTSEDKLPTPERFGYEFLGWYLGEEKVESVSENCTLVAKWVLGEYEVSYDLAGGAWGQNIDSFAEELVAMFNRDGASSTVTTKENFKATSHPQIKTVWAIEANLAAYKWLFEYAAAEILATAKANAVSDLTYANSTAEMLTKMAAGDTTAVGGNYADARTIFRFWLEGVMNHKLTATGTSYYQNLMVDYSVAENAAKFEAALNGVSTTLTAFDKLPTPQKENHNFLGWYLGEEKVEYVVADCTLVAKWEEAYVESEIAYELAEGQLPEGAPATYKEGLGLQNLPVPTREGYNFAGWYMGEELVTEISAAQTGKVTLTASWVAKVYAAISYELNEGELPANAPATYEVGVGLATLPTPTKGAYQFLGWYMGEKLVTEISAEQTGDVTLTAKWSEEEVKEVYVGAGLDYATLDEAVQNAPEGATIILAAGEYSLSVVINKSLTIVGPYKDAEASRERENEAVIKVAKDVAGNLAAKKIVFNGVHLQGTGGGAGIPGVFFQDGGGIEEIAFLSCKISDMNTFVKFVNGTSTLNLRIENSYIHTIGQFALWTASSKVQSVLLLGNIVDGSTCGSVTNAAAALFRVRSGVLEAYNNTFIGDSKNAPGYFEAIAAPSFVKYNTFENVTLFAHPTAANKLTFDQNLYLDKNGKALAAAPSEVAMNGVTVDATVCANAKEVAEAYMGYLVNAQPDRYFRLSFDLDGGAFAGSAPLGYDSKKGLTLPVPQKDNSIFVGWYLNGEKVEAIEAGTTGNLELVAKWREDALYVGVGEDYYYPTLADALAAANDGDKIIIVAGTYNENVTISHKELTIAGPNAAVNPNTGERAAEAVLTGKITVANNANGLTLEGLAFTAGAAITVADVNGFKFLNNFVYDTNKPSTAWAETSALKQGFIYVKGTSNSDLTENFEFHNNKFDNVSDVNVFLSYIKNFSFSGNVFNNFGYDAIRTEGGYVTGLMVFTNNKFTRDTQGAYNGILFRMYGGAGINDAQIVIENNEFVNIGNSSSMYTGAINARNYQEKGADFRIANNHFEGCYNYIRIRNNGTAANHAASTWVVNIEDNEFIGLPTDNYFASRNGTSGDNDSTCPINTTFGANYYEDNDGNVITDLAPYASLFKDVLTMGTASATKPAESESTPLEFYSISYELEGGETRESFTYTYSSYNKSPIALPSLTKTNYQFNGWLLNGELVMEIPADAKGDLVLVAKFTVLEGEVYTIEYVTNKEKALWPSRAAIDREEIIEELFKDLYEWAQSNGETRGYDEYVAATKTLIAGYSDINLRNTKLGNYPAEDGSTEYFFNVPKYYEKWNEFFALFNEAMLAVNATQVFYTDTYATMVRLHQFITWSSTGQGYFNAYLGKMRNAAKIPAEIPTTYRGGQIVQLPELHMANGLAFLGWYDNPEFTGSPITAITDVEAGNKKFYAKWEDEILVETVEINQIDRLLLFESHQLVWNLLPLNATDKEVEFFSSNESVATVSPKGLITGYATGTTTITMKVYGNRALDVQFELTVYCPDYIEGYFEGESYGIVGGELQLKADVLYNDGTKEAATWTSLTPEIATVDANGKVTLLAPGMARIVAGASKNAELKLEYVITVLEAEAADILGFILESHESNVFQRYNLNIGSTYNKDIFGSVSKLLMNYDYSVDASRRDTEKQNNTGDYYDTMESVEFITVHYTGNMAAGADAKANANYFVGANSVSIHYTTGNDGIYQCLDHTTGGFHAGDSGAMAQVGKFQWMPTGVRVGANDAQYPTFTISQDFYFEINGQKTSVKMPTPWNYDSRGTNHTLNADGTISSNSAYKSTAFSGRTPESFINDQDLPFKVVDGEYYMGTTWWCYTQVYEGRICSTGGNRNSVGIESCVNEGSDLWYTWQITAQLVARLMQELNLDITRVRGHHFFSGKNCPQPMLENDLEIWYEFLGLVEAEYELLTEYNDYEISFESHNPEIIDNHGRVIKQPSQTTCVTYTVNITRGGETQSITLATMVQGLYVGR